MKGALATGDYECQPASTVMDRFKLQFLGMDFLSLVDLLGLSFIKLLCALIARRCANRVGIIFVWHRISRGRRPILPYLHDTSICARSCGRIARHGSHILVCSQQVLRT